MLQLKQRSGASYPLPRDVWDLAQLFSQELTGGLDALFCVYLSPELVLGAEVLVLVNGEGFAPVDVPAEQVISLARKVGATAIILCRTARGVAAQVTAADQETLERLRSAVAENAVEILEYQVLGLTSVRVGAASLPPASGQAEIS